MDPSRLKKAEIAGNKGGAWKSLMFDTITYGLTKDLPGGPIYRPADPMPHELFGDESADDAGTLSRGRMIGGVISLVLLVATGAYFFLTV